MPDHARVAAFRRDPWLWDALKRRDDLLIAWFDNRFGYLKDALLQGDFRRDAAIVPAWGERSRLASVEVDGGRDVKHVIAYARDVPESGRPGIQETLTYRTDVAGTDLIYDLTGEFLQGKARPFVGDFRQLPLRVYAVLPFQVERIDLAAQQQVSVTYLPEHMAHRVSIGLRLTFQDASGSAIAGRLPIYLGLRRKEPRLDRGSYMFADEQGRPERYVTHIESTAGDWSLLVRLLLTGDEWSLPLEFVAANETAAGSEVQLTARGLSTRRAPQPVLPDHS